MASRIQASHGKNTATNELALIAAKHSGFARRLKRRPTNPTVMLPTFAPRSTLSMFVPSHDTNTTAGVVSVSTPAPAKSRAKFFPRQPSHTRMRRITIFRRRRFRDLLPRHVRPPNLITHRLRQHIPMPPTHEQLRRNGRATPKRMASMSSQTNTFLQHDHPRDSLIEPATSSGRQPAPITDGVGDLYRQSGRSHPATPAGQGDQKDEAHPPTNHTRRPAAGDAGQGQETFQVDRRR